MAGDTELDNAISVDTELPDSQSRLYTEQEDLTTAARLRQTLSWQTETAGLLRLRVQAWGSGASSPRAGFDQSRSRPYRVRRSSQRLIQSSTER